MHRRSLNSVLAAALAVAVALGGAGCAGSGSGVSEAKAGGAVKQLDFFDHLELRPVATWDEMTAGLLLAMNKPLKGDYAGRLAQARQFGYVGTDAPMRGETPVTPAAFARAALRAQGARIPVGASPDQVVAMAAEKGILPESVKPDSILNGATVVRGLAVVGEPGGMSRGLAAHVPGRLPQVEVTETKLPRSLTTVPIVGTATPKGPGEAVAPTTAEQVDGAGKGEGMEEIDMGKADRKKPAGVPAPVPPQDPNLPRPRPEPLPEVN